MKNILFIGDCHVNKMGFAKFSVPVNCHEEYHQHKIQNLYFHHHSGVSGYGMDYSKFDCIPDADIVVPMFGYIDIKVHLPKFDKVDEAVDKYITNLMKRFDKDKIRLTEPVPQFIEKLGSGEPKYDIDIRGKYQNQYIESLYKHAAKYDLAQPINLREILDAEFLDESFMDISNLDDPNRGTDQISKPKSLILANGILKLVD